MVRAFLTAFERDYGPFNDIYRNLSRDRPFARANHGRCHRFGARWPARNRYDRAARDGMTTCVDRHQGLRP